MSLTTLTIVFVWLLSHLASSPLLPAEAAQAALTLATQTALAARHCFLTRVASSLIALATSTSPINSTTLFVRLLLLQVPSQLLLGVAAQAAQIRAMLTVSALLHYWPIPSL